MSSSFKILKILKFWPILILTIVQTVYAQETTLSVADELHQNTVINVVPTDSANIANSYLNNSLDGRTPQQRFEESPTFNIRKYNYKQQVIVGGVVMFCVTLAMVANNNYNPKTIKP